MRRTTLAVFAMFFAFVSIGVAAVPPPRLTEVAPWTYDPFNGSLVESEWINHIGCPYQAEINTPLRAPTPIRPARRSTGRTRTCRGCCSPRPARRRTSPRQAPSSRASAGSWSTRSATTSASSAATPARSARTASRRAAVQRRHELRDALHRLRLAAADLAGARPGLDRMAWSPAAAFPPIPPGAAVQSIDIVFDEGTDTGPDNFGIADSRQHHGQRRRRRPPNGLVQPFSAPARVLSRRGCRLWPSLRTRAFWPCTASRADLPWGNDLERTRTGCVLGIQKGRDSCGDRSWRSIVTFFAFVSIGAAAGPKLTDVNPWEYDPFNGSLVEVRLDQPSRLSVQRGDQHLRLERQHRRRHVHGSRLPRAVPGRPERAGPPARQDRADGEHRRRRRRAPGHRRESS